MDDASAGNDGGPRKGVWEKKGGGIVEEKMIAAIMIIVVSDGWAMWNVRWRRDSMFD